MKKILTLLLVVVMITGCSTKTNLKNNTQPDDITLNIEGELYQMPIKVSDLIENGWHTSSKPEAMISPNELEYEFVFSKDDKFVITNVENLAWTEQKIEDSHVTKVYVGGEPYRKTNMASITLANSTTMATKLEDVKTNFKIKQTEGYEEKGIYYAMYSVDIDTYYDFKYDVKDDEMISMTVTNRNSESFREATKGDLNLESPKYVSDYSLPKTLSTDINDGMFTLDGVIYEFGMPLSQLIQNGWKIEEKDVILPANSKISVDITKGKFTLSVSLNNPDKKPNTAENSLVHELDLYNYEKDHDGLALALGFGITPTTTYDEALKILGAGASDGSNDTLAIYNEHSSIYIAFTENGALRSMFYEVSVD